MLALVALLALGVSADPTNCPNKEYLLKDGSDGGYHFQASSLVPVTSCLIMFTWYPEQYLPITISTSGMGKGDSISMFTSGSSDYYQSFHDQDLVNKQVTTSWPPMNRGSITLTYTVVSGSKMALNITAVPTNFTVPATPNDVITVQKGQPANFVPYKSIQKGETVIITTNNSIEVKSGYPDSPILSNIWIYYNNYPHPPECFGTLFGENSDRWPWAKNITLYAVDTVNLGGAMLIDDDDDKSYNTYQVFTGKPQVATVDATFAPARFIGAKPVDPANFPGVYITQITLEQDVQAHLTAGAPVVGQKEEVTLLQKYGKKNKNQLPQFIPSAAWTLLVDNGELDDNHAVIEFQPNLPGKSLAYNTRTGFIISDNYPFSSVNQSSTTPFTIETGDSSPFTVAFTVTTTSPNKDATVVIDSGTGNPFTINLSTITVPYTKAFTSKKVNVMINGGTGASNGTYINYTVASTFNYPGK